MKNIIMTNAMHLTMFITTSYSLLTIIHACNEVQKCTTENFASRCLGVNCVPSDLPKDITSLDLSESNLTKLKPTTALKKYESLKRIRLSNCRLENVYLSIFNPKNLLSLNLANNNINEISKNNNVIMNSLEVLDLSDNKISNKLAMLFTGERFPNLDNLDLSFNNIDSLELSFFNKLPLKTLKISNNKIENMVDICDELVDLETFILRSNHIKTMDFNTGTSPFVSCKKLLHLDLSNNYIQAIAKTVFMETTKLKSLQLDSNDIKNISDLRLSKISSLRELSISRNSFSKLSELNKYLPKGLTTLTVEDSINLKTIEPFSFLDFDDLSKLSLKGSKHIRLGKDSFKGLSKLNTLDLSGCNLMEIKQEYIAVLPDDTKLLLEGNQVQCNDKVLWLKKSKHPAIFQCDGQDNVDKSFEELTEDDLLHPIHKHFSRTLIVSMILVNLLAIAIVLVIVRRRKKISQVFCFERFSRYRPISFHDDDVTSSNIVMSLHNHNSTLNSAVDV